MMKASIIAIAAATTASAAPLAPNELLLASFDRCAPSLGLAGSGLFVWLSCICWLVSLCTARSSSPTFYKWSEQNDPVSQERSLLYPAGALNLWSLQVMGGQSSGNFSVVEQGSESYGLFQGTVRNVSFLHAPGFCRFTTVFPGGKHENAAEFLEGGLKITLRERRGEHHRGHGEQYQGFKVAVSSPGASHHHGGHELFGMYKVRRNASCVHSLHHVH